MEFVIELITGPLRPIIHYGLHFLMPVLIARVLFATGWKSAALLMVATISIDLDHLLATPIFDPNRCSIGFHPLHGGWALGGYAIALLGALLLRNGPIARPVAALALGALLHLATDSLDCVLGGTW